MSSRQIIILACVTVWSLSMWGVFYIKWSTPVVIDLTLSDAFKEWEAQSRLGLRNSIIDDRAITQSRISWHDKTPDLRVFAKEIMTIQNHAYGFDDMFLPNLHFATMRGDANGLYIPSEGAIYINSKMQWGELPFERFISVILHENMHHIMTQAFNYIGNENHPLKDDFALLAYYAAMTENGLGDVMTSMHDNNNPQEWVAYRAQNAAKFAGILNAGLDAWNISSLMSELDALVHDANF